MTPITEGMLNDDCWISLAERHVNSDWNCDKPDGFLKAVIALALDYRQQVIADLARESGVMPEVYDTDSGDLFCDVDEVREAIATLQAKLEQSEARFNNLVAVAEEVRNVLCTVFIRYGRRMAPYDVEVQMANVRLLDAMNKEPSHED